MGNQKSSYDWVSTSDSLKDIFESEYNNLIFQLSQDGYTRLKGRSFQEKIIQDITRLRPKKISEEGETFWWENNFICRMNIFLTLDINSSLQSIRDFIEWAPPNKNCCWKVEIYIKKSEYALLVIGAPCEYIVKSGYVTQKMS